MSPTTNLLNAVRSRFDRYLRLAELAGLLAIGVATTVAMASEGVKMVVDREVLLTDLLTMFLYLEVLAMVGQYFKAGQLPVRFPLYIAMVALARELILGIKGLSELHMLASAGAILLLAMGVFVIRYGQVRYACDDDVQISVEPLKP